MLSAARGQSWIGIACVAVLIVMHLLRVARPLDELKLLTCVMVIGGIWENFVAYCGLLSYPSGPLAGLAPVWLLALWALFAAQFNTTYTWLRPHLVWAVLLGMVAGPVSFHAGAALGALHFVKPWPAALTLAIGWAFLLPLVALLSRHWDGVQSQSTRE